MKRFLSFVICILLTASLIPSLAPVSEAAFEGNDKIVIVIDPGHGGANVGTARNGVGEKVKTFELGNLLKQKLEANGNFIVHMTRTGDYDLPLAARGIYANSANADLLVSLHFDGSTSRGDRGVSVITSVLPEYQMVDLANMVCSSLSAKTGLSIKGVIQRKDNAGYYWNAEKQWDCQDPSLGTLSDYYGIPTWCAKFGIGSILIEHGFFTNDGDAAIIFSEGMMDKMAEADAEAIINYYTNHTHTYTSDYIQDFPSNCMFQGKKSIHCTTCGHRKNITDLETAPDNHYWINEKTTAASCGVDGAITHECRITLNLNEKDVPCDEHKETITIAAQPHTYVQTDYREVSHTEDGYTQYTCTNCNHTFKDIVKSDGHSWQLVEEIEPKCTQKGKRTYVCSVCNETNIEDVAALGHSISITETVAATCTKEGYTKSRCTACGEEFHETLKAKGHSFSSNALSKINCTEDVTVTERCRACGLKTEETFPATGHSFEVEILKQNTCTEDGEEKSVCSKCGYEELKVTEKTGHSFIVKEEKKADCTHNGYTLSVCSLCGLEEKTESLAIGHEFITEITAEASIFTQGAKLTSCSHCGEQYREVIPSAWDNPSTKAIVIGVSAVVLAAALTVVMLYLKKNSQIEENEESEGEMVAAAEAIADEAEAEAAENEADETDESESSQEAEEASEAAEADEAEADEAENDDAPEAEPEDEAEEETEEEPVEA